MLTIWGRLNSVNVQKVVWMAGEAGEDFSRIDAGMAFGKNREPEYLARNPTGLVPLLEDGDFTIWESNAIVRYLAAKHPDRGFFPDDIRARANDDRWMDWASGAFYGAYAPVFMGLVRTLPEKRDAAAIEASRAKTDDLVAMLDAALARSPYLAGERFGIGDLVVGCFAHRWLNLPVARTPRPYLEAWYARIRERPAARPVIAHPIT
jgi:glutathione S-transferase